MLLWKTLFAVSFSIFFIGVLWALVKKMRRYKRKRFFTPRRILFGTTFISASLIFVPFYHEIELLTGDGALRWFKIITAALQHAMRLFALEGDFVEMMDFLRESIGDVFADEFVAIYTALMLLYYVFAPILTFQFILSFFKNLSANIVYALLPFRQVHVFSELSEVSMALASNIIKQNGRHRVLIVFTDVVAKTEEESLDLIDEAKEMRALLFHKDLESIHFRTKFSVRKISFYLIGDNEGEKIRHAKSILEHYNYKNVKLYLFSDDVQSKCFFQSYTREEKKQINVEVIRVNEIRSLIYKNLDSNGLRLFENARTVGNMREISAVIVGFGRYGSEMLKALLWYCQLPGYYVKIKVIDKDGNAADRVRSMCPDLKITGEGEEQMYSSLDMRYSIEVIHAAAGSERFRAALVDATYVFVCLGSDSDNVSMSLDIRCTLAGCGSFSIIETVVYDSDVKNRIGARPCGKNVKKEGMDIFDISVIGDIDSLYSAGTVIAEDIVAEGLVSHMRWAENADSEEGRQFARHEFYMNDYNFFSSVAKALHARLRARILDSCSGGKANVAFPFVFSDGGDEESISPSCCYRTVIDRTKTVSEAAAFAAELSTVVDYMYVKITQLHFSKLGAKDKQAVLDTALSLMGNLRSEIEKIPDFLKYLASIILKKDDMSSSDRALVSALYDAIVSHLCKERNDVAQNVKADLEYVNLSAAEKVDVEEYLMYCGCRYTAEQTYRLAHHAALIDHVRWNAYMRSEGYSPASDRSLKSFRYHPMLISVDKLTLRESLLDI